MEDGGSRDARLSYTPMSHTWKKDAFHISSLGKIVGGRL